MSGYTKVGECPFCGSPIQSPIVWQSIDPPPIHYTCGCVKGPVVFTQDSIKENSLKQTLIDISGICLNRD